MLETIKNSYQCEQLVENHSASDMFYSLLVERRSACKAIMPNVHVDYWNECDALLVLRSGYTHEVEIKLSRSDFLADFKKTNWWAKKPGEHFPGRMQRDERLKHDCLSVRDCFPNRFSFLVPKGLVEPEEVPEYAGLMYFSRYAGRIGVINIVRQPPLLHKNKISEAKLSKLCQKFVWRYVDNHVKPNYHSEVLNA